MPAARKTDMKTPAAIFAIAAILFTAPALSDHNRTDEQGRKVSHWTEISDQGDLFEGHYVDGERRGPWSARFANGFVGECLFVKDPDYCDWVVRYADGDVLEDLFGRQLVWRSANSGALESPFVDGKKHGYWAVRDADDYVWAEGTLVDDKKHGKWIERFFSDGGEVWKVNEGSYVDGKKHGKWIERFFIDSREKYVYGGSYVDDKKHGKWVGQFTTDSGERDVDEGSYVDGKKHGKWVVRKANGDVAEKCFENDNEVDC